METAGTIVGVVSLGIFLCTNIVDYCRAWKNNEEDVRVLADLASELRKILQNIDAQVRRTSNIDPAIISKVDSSMRACREHIDAAIRLCDKHRTVQATGAKGKVKELVQKLKFPFEKKVLKELKEIIVAFRGNVDTALQSVTMYVGFFQKNIDVTNTFSVILLAQDFKLCKNSKVIAT